MNYTFTPIDPCFQRRAIARWQADDILNNPHAWGYIYENGTCSCHAGENLDRMCQHLWDYVVDASYRIYPGCQAYDFESLDGRHQETAVTDDPDEYTLSLARKWRLPDADEVIYAVAV